VNLQPASTPVVSKKEETPSKSLRLDESTQIIDEEGLPVEAPSGRVGALLDLLGSTAAPLKGPRSEIMSDCHEKSTSPMKFEDPAEGSLRQASFAEALQVVTKLAQKPSVIKHLKEVILSATLWNSLIYIRLLDSR
jgi:hypothetical protein